MLCDKLKFFDVNAGRHTQSPLCSEDLRHAFLPVCTIVSVLTWPLRNSGASKTSEWLYFWFCTEATTQ